MPKEDGMKEWAVKITLRASGTAEFETEVEAETEEEAISMAESEAVSNTWKYADLVEWEPEEGEAEEIEGEED